jgi:tRNA threonylcarbamoyladenosine modification (KEOPS) complex Cgi121 subunit
MRPCSTGAVATGFVKEGNHVTVIVDHAPVITKEDVKKVIKEEQEKEAREIEAELETVAGLPHKKTTKKNK